MRQGGYLVTRGMTGSATNMIIRGLIPFIDELVEELGGNVLKRGRRRKYDESTKKHYDEYEIYVELAAVNGKDLFDPIINKVKKRIDNKSVDIVATATKLSVKSPDIKINVKIVEKK